MRCAFRYDRWQCVGANRDVYVQTYASYSYTRKQLMNPRDDIVP